MLKSKHIIIILFLITTIVISCSTTKKVETVGSFRESLIEQDTKTPFGYKPDYINNVDIFRIDTAIHYTTKVLNTEVKNGKVRIFFNITDDKGKVYVYANQDKFDKIWCQIQEKSGNESVAIKNYQIFNSTERDTVANAFAFVLDHSGSMGDMRVLTVQNAISNLLTTDRKSEDAAAVIKYDNHVVLEVPLTKDDKLLMSQVKLNGIVEYGGGSAINDGLGLAIDILDADKSCTNKSVVIYTDGVDNASKMSKSEVIAKAKSKGIKIFAIDFGNHTNPEYMSDIAGQTGGCYYHIYNTSEFNQVFADIYKRMKNVYIFEYTPAIFGHSQFKLVLCNNSKKIELLDSVYNEASRGNFILVNIKFDANKSSLKKTFNSEIIKLEAIMKKEPSLKFEIQVHTDDVGEAKSNLSLSQKRADAIKAELIKKGVDKTRISARGFGESMPIADNKTKEGKALNSRIEFVVVE